MKARIACCVTLWLASACSGATAHPVDTTSVLEGVDLAAHYSSAVSQANVDQTICVKGYSASVRPPLSYTAPIKRDLIAALPPSVSHKVTDYELDHVVPLEVGGNPTDRVNLVLQLWPEARAKDVVEDRVHREVCAHKITLAAGRRCFVTGWRKCP